MTKYVGILTAGGDSPGLNAAIRGIGKAAQGHFGMHVIGFRDGFRGLMENRTMELDGNALSGILTIGGTILGTSRDKVHRMPIGGSVMDMTNAVVDNYRKHHLDVLVCLGGGGTQKNAAHLMQQGLNVITLPKTIDNDVAGTDVTFGFDTALEIGTEAIDRLHSTATSHNRIIVVELMGHRAGWLALGAGMAGGADVILIPERPFDIDEVCDHLKRRHANGATFSIVVVAEGATPKDGGLLTQHQTKDSFGHVRLGGIGIILEREIEEKTGFESRTTILGHIQRGGTPLAFDRVLGSRFGVSAVDAISEGDYGKMVALRGTRIERVPLAEAIAEPKLVDAELYETAEVFFG